MIERKFKSPRMRNLKPPTNLSWPPVGAVAEKQSFIWHVYNRMNLRKCPLDNKQREAVLRRLYNHYSVAHFRVPADFGTRTHYDRVVADVNMDGTPGPGYAEVGVTNREVIGKLGHDKLYLMCVEALREMALGTDKDQLVRLFVKQEPTSIEKLSIGRQRLIWAFPLVDQIVAAMIFGPSIDAEHASYQRIPTQVGLPFSGPGWDGMVRRLQRNRKADKSGIKRDGVFLEMDKSGWDWSVPGWLLDMERDARIELCENATPEFIKLIHRAYERLGRTQVIFSDGESTTQVGNFAMKSGHKITLSSNSRMQVILKEAARVASGDLEGGEDIVCMGDDTLEVIHDRLGLPARKFVEQYVGLLRSWGFFIKDEDVTVSEEITDCAFCSHDTVLTKTGQYVPQLRTWPKQHFAAMHQDWTPEEYGQFLYSLMPEYCVSRDDVYEALSEEMLEVWPRLWKSKRFHQDFLLGYETDYVQHSAYRREAPSHQQGPHVACVIPHDKSVRSMTKAKASKKAKGKVGSSQKKMPIAAAPAASSAVYRKPVSKPVIVVDREEIGDIKMFKDKFSNSAALVNPGNPELFPKLSKIAENYTTYKFKKLKFINAPNASTGDGGTVAMGLNPDANEKPPEDMKELLNMNGSVSSAPWTGTAIDAKFASQAGTKFIVDTTDVNNLGNVVDDLHTISDGVFSIASAALNVFGANDLKFEILGQTYEIALDEVATGKLYVEYEVELHDSKLRLTPEFELLVTDYTSPAEWLGDTEKFADSDLAVSLEYNGVNDTNSNLATISFENPGTYCLTGVLYWTAASLTSGNYFTIGFFPGDGVSLQYYWAQVNNVGNGGTLSNPNSYPFFAIFEVTEPNSMMVVGGLASQSNAQLQFASPSSLQLSLVNNESSVLRTLGTASRSPVDMPLSKGFLSLHRSTRMALAEQAMSLGRTLGQKAIRAAAPKKNVVVQVSTAKAPKVSDAVATVMPQTAPGQAPPGGGMPLKTLPTAVLNKMGLSSALSTDGVSVARNAPFFMSRAQLRDVMSDVRNATAVKSVDDSMIPGYFTAKSAQSAQSKSSSASTSATDCKK